MVYNSTRISDRRNINQNHIKHGSQIRVNPNLKDI